MSKRASLPLGIAIIVLGIVVILGKLGVFAVLGALFWPLLLTAVGAFLHVQVGNRRLPPVFLLPGGTLVALSVLFLFHAWFGWHRMDATWPLIPFSVAVGLYEWSRSERHPTLRTVAYGVGIVSLVLFVITLLATGGALLLAVALIALGVFLVARRS